MNAVQSHIEVQPSPESDFVPREPVFQVRDLAVAYGANVAIQDVTLDVFKNAITAFIGPSGCGKSTLIRCFNRMNDLVPSAKVSGEVLYHGTDLYGERVDPVEVRRRNLVGGVMITASHNPASFNGFKVKAHFGGSATPAITAQIEKNLERSDVAIRRQAPVSPKSEL